MKYLEVLLTPTFPQVECYFLEELLKGCVTHNYYAPINVNPVGGSSAGKGWGFDKF